MDGILVVCGLCGARLRARAEFAGRSMKCPRCHAGVLVPTTEPGEQRTPVPFPDVEGKSLLRKLLEGAIVVLLLPVLLLVCQAMIIFERGVLIIGAGVVCVVLLALVGWSLWWFIGWLYGTVSGGERREMPTEVYEFLTGVTFYVALFGIMLGLFSTRGSMAGIVGFIVGGLAGLGFWLLVMSHTE